MTPEMGVAIAIVFFVALGSHYVAYKFGRRRGRELRPLERAKLMREVDELCDRQRFLIEDLEESLRILHKERRRWEFPNLS